MRIDARTEGGQVSVMMAVGMVAVVAMLLFVLNASVTLLSYRALSRAAQDAATAALRSIEAGEQDLDEDRARAAAEDVLTVELGNVRFMQESPADVTAGLDMTVHNPTDESVEVRGHWYYGPVVEVEIDAHLCPPFWACIGVTGRGMTSLETSQESVETATPVPTQGVDVTPTPD